MKKCERILFPKHSWGQWEIKEQCDIVGGRTGGIKGKIIIQQRKCLDCGKIEFNEQRIYA